MIRQFVSLIAICGVCVAADQPSQPSLTIYNQNFAVVRQDLPLDLKAGVNTVQVTDITMHLEPDSVILRDPTGKHPVQVLEQNYRADPVTDSLLLSLYEGKTIDFLVSRDGKDVTVPGKIIRSGYVPHSPMAMNLYGSEYYQAQMRVAASEQPIVEMDGKIRFGLPGTPLFPSLADDSVLKPTLQWLLTSQQAGAVRSEFSYVTGGLTWQADYNIVAPDKGDVVDLVGWVTMDNQSGKTFENARIKLMAGDVNKIQSRRGYDQLANFAMRAGAVSVAAPAVTERTFDEYHLYTLARSTTLHDRETKQVEFVNATGVSTKQVYIYDGVKIDLNRYNGWNWENIRNEPAYGTESNPKIWVMREFVNSEANHLGLPLPKGRLRFYRRNDDGQIEFTGENVIDHTPRDETIRVYTGNAFDLAGERRRTNYNVDNDKRTADESFEIKVRNHKKEPVNVRVVEHLYRWTNWDISSKSDSYKKTDGQTIEFPVTIAPDGEKTITYTAHYSW
ncbi:MAG TPA: DUF4139 domain-containing protein [Candidatus Acidoferrum sp.]|jgi:hypothetical protein|nr:DUF4139 domain-containing protein [Candidatus Acidoferrum sp.]